MSSTAGGCGSPMATARKEVAIFVPTRAGSEASNMATGAAAFKPLAAGRKQHSSTDAGGGKEVSLTAGICGSPMAPTRKEDTIILTKVAETEESLMEGRATACKPERGRTQHSWTATGGGKGRTLMAGGEEMTAPAWKEETIFLSKGDETKASSTATGMKQHSMTATGGMEGVSLTAGGEESPAPAKREETVF